jgi:N-acetylglucosamine kinase-like BadF-type ATPase
VQLAQGTAMVNDSCFTGDTNVVLCTDATAANAVECAAGKGKLTVAGTGSDLINYARAR